MSNGLEWTYLMLLTWMLTLARSFLAAIFLASSLPKLRQPHTFISAVAAYHLLPQQWVRPFATTLPYLELSLGLMLLLGWGTRVAASASIFLLLIFLVAMGINLARGRKDPSRASLDCGRSGKRHVQKIGWNTIARNVFLIMLCLPVAVWGSGLLALDTQAPAVQEFVVKQVILNALLPLVLSGVGLHLLSRLLRQMVRLVMLTPVDVQTSGVSESVRSLYPAPVELQK